ncbi:hypothetical protein OCU04_011941 [Sclerotinia nivalis]|uniref:Uncharacterized protein n=1 Tax=Sclerotinia nivalis TaxID=352851 RepID=A0A9X0AA36_9HELO|nr:hypothetical protein OCU04_011941 [Sclerotinia nivalis]
MQVRHCSSDLRIQVLTVDENYYLDIDMNDVGLAIDDLFAYAGGWEKDTEYEFTKSKFKEIELDPVLLGVPNDRFGIEHPMSTLAAKVCCLGEQNFLDRDKFIEGEIALNHPIC